VANEKNQKPVAAQKPVAPVAPVAAPVEAEAPKPEVVELKAIAEKLSITPRETRVILRAIKIRGEDQKRARWTFAPAEVPDVIAKVKKYQADKAKAAADRAAAEEAEAKKKAAEAAAAPKAS
jgi:hypothetical protein